MKDLIPKLNIECITIIKNTPTCQKVVKELDILEFLNVNKAIGDLKLPLSYGVAI
jgi:hypothetical protein